MRIGIDIKAFKNGSTGIARYLRSLMDELQIVDRDNDYFLFTCAPSTYKIVNPKWQIIVTPWKLPGILWQQLILPKLLVRYKINTLWAPEQICPIYCSKAIKIITTVHDLTFIRFPETSQVSNRWIQRVLFPQTINRSSIIIPVSVFIRREIEQTYLRKFKNKQIEPVFNGSPNWMVPQNYSIDKRQNHLFFPGNLEPRKNLPRLIKSLELLHEKHGLSVPLHLAGPAGWKNNTLFSLIENSPIKHLVTHLGYLSEEALQKEYLECKALVYPSLYEGFGLPVLEALALDCPVLTSKNTVMEEIAGDAALYFDPTNHESISETIKALYSASFKRMSILRHRDEICARYSWKREAKKLLSLISTCK
jgi:glycosyltransferase involved in cell wall biosynthesis